MADLLSYSEVQKLLDELPQEHHKLVDDIIPDNISVSGVQRVLQQLLSERVSIRDLATILEGIAESTGFTNSLNKITEHVRNKLSRQICAACQGDSEYLPLIVISPEWEVKFMDSLVGDGDEKQLAMPPSILQEFITTVREKFEEAAIEGEVPVLLTSPMIRTYVRSIIERFRSQTTVLYQSEIHPHIKLKTIGKV